MKAMIALALIVSGSAFAQNGRQNGNNGGYYPTQEIEVLPGSVTRLTVGMPTVVRCNGTAVATDPALRCTLEKVSDTWGTVLGYVIKQNGKELSARRNKMDEALADLTALRNSGICN